MPTGYTHKVSEGTEPSFESFVLRCSRTFGACINQRDSNDEYPNPSLATPGSYYSESMAEAKQELNELCEMSPEDLLAVAVAEYKDEKQHILDKIEEQKNQLDRYNEMLNKVLAWEPPTSEHTGLKDFMLEQLRESIRFDSMSSYYLDNLAKLEKPTQDKIESIRAKKVKDAQSSYEYAEKQYNDDAVREDNRKQWILDLFDNLNVDVVDDKVIPRST